MVRRVDGDAELLRQRRAHDGRGIVERGGEGDLRVVLILLRKLAAHQRAGDGGGRAAALGRRLQGMGADVLRDELTDQHATPQSNEPET